MYLTEPDLIWWESKIYDGLWKYPERVYYILHRNVCVTDRLPLNQPQCRVIIGSSQLVGSHGNFPFVAGRCGNLCNCQAWQWSRFLWGFEQRTWTEASGRDRKVLSDRSVRLWCKPPCEQRWKHKQTILHAMAILGLRTGFVDFVKTFESPNKNGK